MICFATIARTLPSILSKQSVLDLCVRTLFGNLSIDVSPKLTARQAKYLGLTRVHQSPDRAVHFTPLGSLGVSRTLFFSSNLCFAIDLNLHRISSEHSKMERTTLAWWLS